MSKRLIVYIFSFSSIAISLTVVAASLGALIATSYSTFCKFVVSRILFNDKVTFFTPPTIDGRRPAYLCALPILVIGSAGVASAQSILRSCFGGFSRPWVLLLVRRLERVSLEIFKLEDSERGRAMGVFFAVSKSNFYP